MFPSSRFWLKPFSLGFQPGMSPGERTTLHAVNLVTFSSGLGCTFFAVLNGFNREWHLFPFNAACSVLCAIGLVLLYRQQVEWAVGVVCGVGGCVICLQAYQTGNGVEIGLIFLLVFVSFVMGPRWPRRLLAFACGLGFWGVRMSQFQSKIISPERYAINLALSLCGIYLLVAIFRAVGESYRRESEEKTREVEAQRLALQKANEAKEKLFALVAHDLRGPIIHLKEAIDYFAAGRLTPDQFENIRGILRDDVHRLHASLENILQWSSGQMASGEPRFVRVPLREAAEETVAFLHMVARGKGIDVQIEIPGDAAVRADTGQLQAILRNLLSNALKFTDPLGRVVLTARRLAVVSRGGLWEIAVIDTGSADRVAGAGAAAVCRVLAAPKEDGVAEPAWGTAREKGLGLGLRLSREFVAVHGGTIRAEESPDGGTAVFVTLPEAPAGEPLPVGKGFPFSPSLRRNAGAEGESSSRLKRTKS